ncbi:uncharacterized protein LOC113772134 [Coffea eugenioides]|uniref:uncharacterized protein LOC113772134 n=1 Tax=Coffea eugenioides TaxID=49369 RepID=UPI000F614455|nr:uncharacterized protein LOC113772134 [Coffea eugenioides]
MFITMGSSKSSKRSKWYMCFKPDVDDHPFKPVSRLGKGGKEHLLHHSDVFMSLSDGDKLDSSSDDGQEPLSKKSKRRRGFSRVFKAFLFQSPLAKRKGSRKSEKEAPCRPSKFDKLWESFRDKKSSISLNKESLGDSPLSGSSRSSLFSSSTAAASSSLTSSRASSIASNSRSASERKRSSSLDSLQLNQKPPAMLSKKTNGYCNSNVGLYFLLICLVALIFWGKAFAVFCTSTCLFLIPCRFKRVDDQSGVNVNNTSVEVIDVDSEEHKKKVIMGGLLQRNNRSASRVL